MANSKELELWVILADPSEARHYIKHFDWSCLSHLRPTEITTDSGRKIDFRTMNDDEAVIAAMEILRKVQVPMEMNQKQFELEH
jgi:hypothetical protein